MTVVLGYDGSPAARGALAAALDVAGGFGERLVVVYSVEPPGAGVGEEYGEHRAAIEEVGRAATAEALEAAVAAGVDAEVLLAREQPVEALLAAAESHDARMIVVGTYGESPLRSAILGSVPHRLLQRSSRPVLVAPAPGR